MQRILTYITSLSLCLGLSAAMAQSSASYGAPARASEDWNRVRNLEHDEAINVWTSHKRHIRCLFTGATDDTLFCEPAYSRWHDSRGEYRFGRGDVEKIRLEQSQRNLKTCIVATGIAGSAAGSALTQTRSSGQRVLGGLAGGLAGTMAGLIIGVPVAIFVPGQLVYERPKTRRSAHADAKQQLSQPSGQTESVGLGGPDQHGR